MDAAQRAKKRCDHDCPFNEQEFAYSPLPLAFADNPVLFIHLDDARGMPFDLILGVKLVAEDDDLVSDRTFARRRAVQHDLAASSVSGHRVGGEPLPVVEIGNDDGFIGQDPGRLQQILIHGQAALVVEACVGHRCAMNLGPQHLPEHLDSVVRGEVLGVRGWIKSYRLTPHVLLESWVPQRTRLRTPAHWRAPSQPAGMDALYLRETRWSDPAPWRSAR